MSTFYHSKRNKTLLQLSSVFDFILGLNNFQEILHQNILSFMMQLSLMLQFDCTNVLPAVIRLHNSNYFSEIERQEYQTSLIFAETSDKYSFLHALLTAYQLAAIMLFTIRKDFVSLQ